MASWASGPSNIYIDLPPGGDRVEYTAPANGRFVWGTGLNTNTPANDVGFISLILNPHYLPDGNLTGDLQVQTSFHPPYHNDCIYIKANKGDKVMTTCSQNIDLQRNWVFRFVYDNGSKPGNTNN